MSDSMNFLWISCGVIVAVIFPVLSGFMRSEFPPTGSVSVLPPWVKKYGALLLFSLVTSVVCLAIWRSTHPDSHMEWFTAFLLGFGWESTIEKFQKNPPASK
jgi:hypothetical protein